MAVLTRRHGQVAAGALVMLAMAGAVAAGSGPATIVDLQPDRIAETVTVDTGDGRTARATLTNLNPAVNAWYVLALDTPAQTYHLENADPARQRLRLDEGGSLRITGGGQDTRCTPWRGQPRSALQQARASATPFAPLCDARVWLRNPVAGGRTPLEATSEFLRDHVWGGERIVGFVRRELFADSYARRGAPGSPPVEDGEAPGAPPAAAVRPEAAARAVVPTDLGIDVGPLAGGLAPGRWRAVRGSDGVYVSAITPAAVTGVEPVRRAGPWQPDAAEADALAFLVAFDLTRYSLGFSLGTDHPRLGWSARVREDQRDGRLPGPDGIARADPLVRTGVVTPASRAAIVATFTGGFKREHGAFRWGDLATREQGSHYGFVEEGVVFSRLVPGLSTLYTLADGTVDLKTWRQSDGTLMPRLRDARQNGVPLVERDATSGQPMPGALVDRWGPGNWSGSADEKLRTLRAGACLIDAQPGRFLAYGWFSNATPATMARVFLAFGCRDAMHLDMNALEHTYLALYVRDGPRVTVEHLVTGMAQLDRGTDGAALPRFLVVPDNRDFFYVTRREPPR